MKNINFESEESINTYGSDVTEKLKSILENLNIEYHRKHEVSEELYKELKTSRYSLIFLIRSAEKEVLENETDLSNLIESKEKLALLKEKNNSIKIFKARINYLYHVLSVVTSKVGFYASHVDYSKRIKAK